MKRYFKIEYIILIPIIILNIISLLYLYNSDYFKRQLLYLVISYIMLFIVSIVNYRIIFKYSKYLYWVSNILLLLVLFLGREINGSRAWLSLYGISIQPSELVKLGMIVYLSYLTYKGKNILLLIILTIIPSILTYLEPDTGAILFYLIILLTLIKYLKNKKKKVFLWLLIIIIFLSINIVTYIINKDILINIYGSKIFYRIDRIISFKNQNNIQNVNSLISIGSHNLIYIPEAHNDFIFAAVISKYNVWCFIIIMICFSFVLLYYVYYLKYKRNISNIYNHIVLNMLLFQIFYNVLMNLSMVPIIGIPLPFLSYGGSYLIVLYTMVGLSINLNINNKV